jgi:hypothetical protein
MNIFKKLLLPFMNIFKKLLLPFYKMHISYDPANGEDKGCKTYFKKIGNEIFILKHKFYVKCESCGNAMEENKYSSIQLCDICNPLF